MQALFAAYPEAAKATTKYGNTPASKAAKHNMNAAVKAFFASGEHLDPKWAAQATAAGCSSFRSGFGLSEAACQAATEALTLTLTLYDLNGDGVFDFDEFINLVSDLLCLREGVLFASPQAGRNLAEVLARRIPGPSGRLTIEVADLVELDGRWASLITQPDVVAAGGAGLRSLSDQRLHGDLEDLRARRLIAAATEDRTLALIIKKGNSGACVEIECSPLDTIGNVKAKFLESQASRGIGHFTLLRIVPDSASGKMQYLGSSMRDRSDIHRDERTLAAYNIESGSTLHASDDFYSDHDAVHRARRLS